MIKLFITDIKMLFRNTQALFWSFAFPLIFTFIFGAFFGKGGSMAGTVALINQSNTPTAISLEKAMKETDLFKIKTDLQLKEARDEVKTSKLSGIVIIPKDFGATTPNAPTKVKVIYDPANSQSFAVVTGFINQYLTAVNFQIQNAKPIFSISEEKTNTRNLTYFDFVLIGLIGMALMNSSIQGVSISMAKYREDKILKRITTTPLPVWKFVFAEVLSRLIINFIQVGLVLTIGFYVFDAHIYGPIWLILVLALIGAILFQSIGFVIASLSRTTQAAEGMSVAITIPMMFLAGVFFPIDQLPGWLYSIVKFLPLAPLLRMIRTVGLENGSVFTDPNNLLIVAAWIILALAISIYKFRLTEE